MNEKKYVLEVYPAEEDGVTHIHSHVSGYDFLEILTFLTLEQKSILQQINIQKDKESKSE